MSYRERVPDDTIDKACALVFTAEAAAAIGVSRQTLNRWERQGKATPAWKTPGGHAKWDVRRLKTEVGLT